MGSQEYKNRVSRASALEFQKYGHTLEVRSSFFNKSGGIRDSENFNLASYEARSYSNDKVAKETYRDIHIAFEGDYNEDGQAPLGTVKDTAIPHSKEVSHFDNVENSKTLVEGVRYLLKHRKSLLIEVGVDPILALTASLREVDEGTANILKLTNHSEEVKEIIQDILTSSNIDDLQDLTLVERIEQEVDKQNA